MGLNDRIREARIQNHLTQEQLAEKVGVAKSTLTGYEKGNREPNIPTLMKIMEVLHVDANYLYQDDINTFSELVVTLEERELLKKYRALDEHGKKMVDYTLSEEYRRSEASREKTDDDNIIPYPEYPTVTKKDIKSFVARNKKKNFTEKDIAELIYTLFPNGDE